MKTPRSSALRKSSSRLLSRRRVSASLTPIEELGNEPERSRPAVSKPTTDAKRSHTSSFGAVGSRTRTWIRSGETAVLQRCSTSRRSSERQFKMAVELRDSCRPYSTIGVVAPFLRLSCQLAAKSPRGSRAVTTRCTWAGARASTMAAACLREAAAKNSWLISPVPSVEASSASTRSQSPRWCSGARSWAGSSRTVREAHRWSRRSTPGTTTPRRRSSSRLAQMMVCR